MYESFFQFNEAPFNLTPDPRFVYLSPGHQEVLEHMIYGIDQRKGFILIAGDIGAGKTTLTRLLLDRLDEQIKTALIFNTFLSEIELLRAINRDFGLPAEGSTREELIETLNRFLIDKLAAGGNAVLIIDEAQNLSVPVMEQIRMLSNLETETKKLIQIILVGQPELSRTLDQPGLKQLNQRIAVRCHLSPMKYEDTVRYIHHRVSVAGPQSLVRFHPRAYRLIHRFSGGVPRQINAICDRALLVAFSQGTHLVRPSAVRQAWSELAGYDRPSGWAAVFHRKSSRSLIPAVLLFILVILASYFSYTTLKGGF